MIKVLIGSSVRQKAGILEQFLLSLYSLHDTGLKIDYAFVDDNDDERAGQLLRRFRPLTATVWFIQAEPEKAPYVCDEEIHQWTDELAWRVGYNKDLILKQALREQYDYVFLIDSDLLLFPETLLHLISSQKDIISEVFWTRWSNTHELPNVWLKDQYTLFKSGRGETLDDQEEKRRSFEFTNQLRQPGIYRVGGLGACTLISLKALEAGVSYREIYNLSFEGEDRHFCIRAAALGFELFADTFYPCYHIYREKDLQGVAVFLQSITQRSSTAFAHLAGHIINQILESSWSDFEAEKGASSIFQYFSGAGWLLYNAWLDKKRKTFGDYKMEIAKILVNKAIMARNGSSASLSARIYYENRKQGIENLGEENLEVKLIRNIGWQVDGWVSIDL